MMIRLFFAGVIFLGIVQNSYSLWPFSSKKGPECNTVDRLQMDKNISPFKEIMIAMTCPDAEQGSSTCFQAGKLSCRLSYLGRGGVKVVNKGKCCEIKGFLHQKKNCREKAISFTCPKEDFNQFKEKNIKINQKIELLSGYSSGEIVTIEYNDKNKVLFEKLKGKNDLFKKAEQQKCAFLIQNIFNRGDLLSLNIKSKDELKGIQEDLLCSLYQLRKNSLIHGDIKPQNFLCNQLKNDRTRCFLHDNDDLIEDNTKRNGGVTYAFTYQFEPKFLKLKNKNIIKDVYGQLDQQDWIKNDVFAVFRTLKHILNQDSLVYNDPFSVESYNDDKNYIDWINYKGPKNEKRDKAFEYYSKNYSHLVKLANVIDLLNDKNTVWDSKKDIVSNLIQDAVKAINPNAPCLGVSSY